MRHANHHRRNSAEALAGWVWAMAYAQCGDRSAFIIYGDLRLLSPTVRPSMVRFGLPDFPGECDEL